LPNRPTASKEPEVKLIVFISDKFFIKKADAIKDLTTPTAIGYGVDIPFVCEVMKACPANRKGRVVSGTNGSL
jgi:hypothetical protein